MNSNRLAGGTLVVAVAALVVAVAALAFSAGSRASAYSPMGGGPMGGGMMGGGYGGHMMGGIDAGSMMNGQGWWSSPAPAKQPGDATLLPGTSAAPRTIRIDAGPGDAFYPSSVSVQRGETITFLVTTMGPVEHEFMVGPAEAVAADQEGTPEISSISMMQTRSLTYTFDGSGPYAYACHEPGHWEAGMRGTITIVG